MSVGSGQADLYGVPFSGLPKYPMSNNDDYKPTTRLVHGPSHSAKWDFSHHVTPPLSSSTTYRLDSAERGARGFTEFGQYVRDDGETPVYIYDRLDEPTRSILEGELCDAEGGECCVTFASGMAAIAASMSSILALGDEIVTHPVVYGCTHSLFTNWYPKFGFPVHYHNLNDIEGLAQVVSDKTRVLFMESPANPTLELIDLGALRAFADKVNERRPDDRKLLIYVDNTFATPFCQRPIALGADVVLHSLTKNIGGFGTEIGGAVIAPKSMLSTLLLYRKDFGAILSSKSAWAIMVYGLPTLPLRLKRQQYTANIVAPWLEKFDGIVQVTYPGLDSFPQRDLAHKQLRDFDNDFAPGNMIYFTVNDDVIDAKGLLNYVAENAYSVTLAVSLGHTKTLIESPANMTHSSYTDGSAASSTGIRLSIGLESPGDIQRDLEAAISAARRNTQPA